GPLPRRLPRLCSAGVANLACGGRVNRYRECVAGEPVAHLGFISLDIGCNSRTRYLGEAVERGRGTAEYLPDCLLESMADAAGSIACAAIAACGFKSHRRFSAVAEYDTSGRSFVGRVFRSAG